MLKAIKANLETQVVVFEDQETKEKYQHFYISPVTNELSFYCRMGHEATVEELETYGELKKEEL